MSLSYANWVKSLRTHIGSSVYPDSAVRWTPDAVNVPEGFGVRATNHIAGLTTLTLLQRTFANKVDVENQTELKSVSLPNLTVVTDNFVIKNNTNLSSLSAPNIGLPTFGSSVTGSSLDFSGNALNATDIDNLFNRLALSLSSGHAYYCTINVSGGTNAVPTNASSLALSSLYLGATAHQITVSKNS